MNWNMVRMAASIFLLAAPLAINASAQTWDGGGANDNWSSANNWNPNVVPANDGTATLTFGGVVRRTPNMDAGWWIRGLAFAPGATNFTIGGGNTLTLHDLGITFPTGGLPQRLSMSNIILSAPQTWSVGGLLLVDSSIDLQSNTLTVTGSGFPEFFGSLSGTAPIAIIKNGTGRLTLNGTSSQNGTFFLDEGILRIRGSYAGGVEVSDDSRLEGNGTVGGTVTIAGTVRPGPSGFASIGTLTIQNYREPLNSFSTQDVELGGLIPGIEYDQINILGTADFWSTLNVSLLNAFDPPIGSSFDVVTASSMYTDTFIPRFGNQVANLPLLSGRRWRVDHLPMPPGFLIRLSVVDECEPWSQLTLTGVTQLARHSMVYDSARGVTVMFGGQYSNRDVLARSDTLEWNGTAWSSRNPDDSPLGRYAAAMAFDSLRGKTVLFGGSGIGINLEDTWEWDGSNWMQYFPLTHPSGRYFHAMAFDAQRGRTVLFGGTSGADQTWEWDGAHWSLRASGPSGPSARWHHAMAYDSARGVTVMYGGAASTVNAETWEWDGNSWTLRIATSAPGPRQMHSMAYDATRNVTLLFGGNSGPGSADLGDTWEWDGITWTLRPDSGPSPRSDTAMAYDTARERCVLFGGMRSGTFLYLNDTWELRNDLDVQIDQQPSPHQSVDEGDVATLTTVVIGAEPIRYQWRHNGVDLSDGGSVSGATTATLTINSVAAMRGGVYDCVVSNTCSTVTTDASDLSVWCVGGCASPMRPRMLLADRTNNGLYRISDADGDHAIQEPGEVSLWFNASNAAGTLGPSNPTSLAVRRDAVCFMGDSDNRCVYRLRDLNNDGDAQDIGESQIVADASNLSGVSFAFPTGVAFDQTGTLYVVNAGNAFGFDGVYRCTDVNNDGDYQDAGEISEYLGAPYFGPGNGPYSPQELYFESGGTGYLRNSNSALQGVIRFTDGNNNGRADDVGESTTYLDPANASGVPVATGSAVERIPGSMADLYTLSLAAGGVDQLLRAADYNSDGDAQDPGEAQMVWSNAASGLVAIDILALNDRELLLTDNSSKKVFRLFDSNSDGVFDASTEQTVYFANSSTILGDVRQIALLPCPGDLNGDQVVDLLDLTNMLANFGTAIGATVAIGDEDEDGDVELDDLTFLLARFGASCM